MNSVDSPDVVHYDFLGTEIKIGDLVAHTAFGYNLKISTVERFTNKMVVVSSPNGKSGKRWYSQNLIVVDQQLALLKLIKGVKS